MEATAPDGANRTSWFDPVDATGAAIVLWFGLWIAAAAIRSEVDLVGSLTGLATAVGTYVLARIIRRRSAWLASMAVTLAVATVALLRLDTVIDPSEGPIGYANATAAFFLLGAVHAIIVARNAPARWLRTTAGLTAVLFVAVPWLNASRTAAVLTLLLLLPLVVRAPRRGLVTAAATVAALSVVGVIGVTSVIGGLYAEPSESSPAGRLIDATVSERRLELWHDAAVLTAEDPLRGVGLGRFAETSPTAILHPEQGWAHHEYLQLAAETGIPGMVLLIALVLWGFARAATRAADPNVLWVIVGWMAISVHASFDYVLHFPAVLALAGALLGSAAARGGRALESRDATTRGSRGEPSGPTRDRDVQDVSPGPEGPEAGHLSLSGTGSRDHARARETSTARDPGPLAEEGPMGEPQRDAARPSGQPTGAASTSPSSVPDGLGDPRPTDVLTRQLLPRVRAAVVHMRLDYALVALDATLVVAAYAAALMLRFDGAVPDPFASRAPRFFAMAVVAHLLTNGLAGLYGHVWTQASIDEARRVVVANAMAAVWLLAWVSALPSERAPLTVVISGGAIAMLLTGVVRFRTRLFAFQIGRSSTRGPLDPDRVIVVGSGVVARGVIEEMRGGTPGDYRPVAIIDRDPATHGRTLLGLPIAGDLEVLPTVARDHRADLVLMADPDADRGYVEDVMTVARSAGLDVKVLPNVTELMGQTASVRDVRDLAITDLLGRKPVPTDLAAIRGILDGRRVLVTGGGGSIGSELARQISACDPEMLILLDHDETHLHDAVARMKGDVVPVLADVRDPSRIDRVMAIHRPDIIFHAAAHKHVPILEGHPGEAVATNVLGTQNLIRSARVFDVDRFVFISTDKAVNPRSVMGATKRLGEQLVLQSDQAGDVRFCAVRFGNVLGSRGSVIPTFVEQIRRGGPVTVTHPDMTRFFMTIPEATQLVLQAAAFSRGGEIFMLDMGDPVRIVDLAQRMIQLSGRRPDVDIEVRFTGLRPGEKLEEELATVDEVAHPTAHPSIAALEPTLLDPRALRDGIEHLRQLTERHADEDIVRVLFDLAEAEVQTVLVLPEAEPEQVIKLPLAQVRQAHS